jgi:hypothetical protein
MKLAGLDLHRIFEEGFKDRVTAADQWHIEDPDDYFYHASGLSSCDRQQVLKRMGKATDGLTLETIMTFEVGHHYHGLLEEFARKYEAVEPRFKVLALEAGGAHPSLPLKARCDLLFSWKGKPVLCDLKTESPFSKDYREADQKKYGYPFPYKPEHLLQVTAQAMVIEALMRLRKPISEGRILYLNKSTMAVDQVPLDLGPDPRATVLRRLALMDRQWGGWTEFRELPPRLKARTDLWRCRPREVDDERGLYCAARSACMKMPER